MAIATALGETVCAEHLSQRTPLDVLAAMKSSRRLPPARTPATDGCVWWPPSSLAAQARDAGVGRDLGWPRLGPTSRRAEIPRQLHDAIPPRPISRTLHTTRRGAAGSNPRPPAPPTRRRVRPSRRSKSRPRWTRAGVPEPASAAVFPPCDVRSMRPLHPSGAPRCERVPSAKPQSSYVMLLPAPSASRAISIVRLTVAARRRQFRRFPPP